MNLQKIIKTLGIGCILFLLFLVVGYHCPIQTMTGFPCPGCNMTTSLVYLFKGDIQTSLYYHLLLIPTILCSILIFIFRKNKRRIETILIAWAIGMIVYYILRMIFIFPNAPMFYETNSLLYQFLAHWACKC